MILVYREEILMFFMFFNLLYTIMQKIFFGLFLIFAILITWCDFDGIGDDDGRIIDTEKISEIDLESVKEKAKELGKEYYDSQVKPYVDDAKNQITGKIEELKKQYNVEVEKINTEIQRKADSMKEQVNQLKFQEK